MSKMLKILSLISFIGSIFTSFYVGFWLLYIGGLIELINGIKSDLAPNSDIIWGLIKIIIAGPIGVIIFSIGVYIYKFFRELKMEYISPKEYWDVEQYLFEEHCKSCTSPEDYQELEDLICTIKQSDWKSGGSFFEWRDK